MMSRLFKPKKGKYMNLKIIISALSVISFNLAASLSQDWPDMQSIYEKLQKESLLHPDTTAFIHPYWKDKGNAIAQDIILADPDQNFLMKSHIPGHMIRIGVSATSAYEVAYLQNNISANTKALLAQFQETTIGGIPWDCPDFNCSINSLQMLFYLSKILENRDHSAIKIIVEFGGGFGALARVAKQIIPNSTYFIIDLPELIALQYIYLKTSLPHTTILAHTTLPDQFEPNAFHLIPTYLLSEFNVNADVFVSTFAITETTLAAQNAVLEKKFFDAPLSYIVGQLHGNPVWEDPTLTINGMNQYYTSIQYGRFHNMTTSAFEMIGKK